MRLRLLLAALALPLALAGCGDEGSSAVDGPATTSADPATETPAETSTETSTETPTEVPTETAPADPEPTGPACREVWVDGKRLPKGYAGCVNGSGFVKADRLGCSSGQRIVRYDDRFWAYERGPISRTSGLRQDDEYVVEVTTCRG